MKYHNFHCNQIFVRGNSRLGKTFLIPPLWRKHSVTRIILSHNLPDFTASFEADYTLI